MSAVEESESAKTGTTGRVPANGHRRQTQREEDLETQIQQLQTDIRSITETLGRMGQRTVRDVQASAQHRAQDLAERGQSMLDSAQGEIGALERQLKDTIRDKPLTAVAGAVAIGFLIAVMTR